LSTGRKENSSLSTGRFGQVLAWGKQESRENWKNDNRVKYAATAIEH
jgi:hypothetical protein